MTEHLIDILDVDDFSVQLLESGAPEILSLDSSVTNSTGTLPHPNFPIVGQALPRGAKKALKGRSSFDMTDNLLLFDFGEKLACLNEAAKTTKAATGRPQHLWQQTDPHTDYRGAPFAFRQFPSILFGGNDYLLADSAEEAYTHFSFSMWVYIPSVPGVTVIYLMKSSSNGGVNELILGTQTNGTYRWYTHVRGTSRHTVDVIPGIHNVVWTFEDKGGSLGVAQYIDGVSVGAIADVATTLNFGTSEPWIVGADADSGFSIGDFVPNGWRIQDLGIWRNRVLTAQDAALIYANGLKGIPLPTPEQGGLGLGLRMLFRGEVNNRIFTDFSGSGNDATLVIDTIGSDIQAPHLNEDGVSPLTKSMGTIGNPFQCVDSTDFGMNDDASMFIVFNTTTLAANQGLFGKHSTSNAGVGNGHNLVQVWVQATGYLRFHLHGDPGVVDSAQVISPNTWYTLLVTLQSIGGVDTRVRMYLQGELIVSQVVFGRTVNNGPQSFTGAGRRNWTVGIDWDTTTRGDPFIGRIQTFAVINRRLLDDEAKILDILVRGDPQRSLVTETATRAMVAEKFDDLAGVLGADPTELEGMVQDALLLDHTGREVSAFGEPVIECVPMHLGNVIAPSVPVFSAPWGTAVWGTDSWSE